MPLLAQPNWTAEQVISPADTSYQVKAIAVSPKDASVWVLAANIKATPEIARLWRVEAGGSNRIAVPLAATKMERFEGAICAASDGSVYLVGWMRNRSHLVRFAPTGETTIRPLGLDGINIMGLEASQHGLLLVGSGNRGGFAARIDEDGRKLWAIDVDKHPLAAILSSGTMLEDGSTLLAGNVWDFHQGKIGMGRGNTLLLRVDARGNIVQEKSFPGRIASAARARGGDFLVVDDPQSYPSDSGPSIPAAIDPDVYARSFMRLQAWRPNLTLAWTAPLPEFHMQFLHMAIRPGPAGGAVLIGTGRRFDLIASEYDGQGRQVWTTTDPSRQWSVLWLASSVDSFVLAHQVYDAEIRIALAGFNLK
ncbi:MAG TPA: hypothetical protein VEU96_19910 [Bryobacteraceae bacterium]|nr:hypothetical protein [Bryobacteraceae bacterium]